MTRRRWAQGPAEVRSQGPAEGGHKDPLKVDRSDPLKLGCDEFTTIVGEEMGGGKKVAHRRDRLHCGIYAHAAWYSGAARHPYPNSLPG